MTQSSASPVDIRFPSRVTRFTRILIGAGEMEAAPTGLRLVLDGAQRGVLSDSELNDLRGFTRRDLPWRPPLRMEVEACASHAANRLVGTAGFGFWNDPFNPAQGLTAAPNAVWFFFASPPARMPFVPGGPPNGWKAATLNGGAVPESLVALGLQALRIPILGQLLYRLARGRSIAAAEATLTTALDAPHLYRIEWRAERADFWVDDVHVLRSTAPPRVPLGFVAWVDNNCASETVSGDLTWERLATPQREWLELRRVTITGLRA